MDRHFPAISFRGDDNTRWTTFGGLPRTVSFLAPFPNCASPPAAPVMILQTHRALARLFHYSSLTYLDKHGLAALAFNFTRASTLRRTYHGRWETTDLDRTALETTPPHRSYAAHAVSRPKAHTGRTTSAPRKKASRAKTATLSPGTEPATATQQPAAKKVKSKAKPKPKPRTRAKSTKARKKSAKAKAKPAKKKKKALKPEEKERLVLKELKAKALTPPKQLPASAFSVLLVEKQKEARAPVKAVKGAGAGAGAGSVAKDCSRIYRSFTPEQREQYNHVANQNKATNDSKYREWILSHSPKEIYEANRARRTLKSRLKTPRSWPKLQDERLVTGRRSPYIRFHIQRRRSGDFAGLTIGEAAKLIGAEWRGLSESDKKVSFLEALWQVIAKADPITKNPNEDLRINVADPDVNLTQPWGLMLPSYDIPNTAPVSRLGKRPGENLVWPAGHAGEYHIRFNHYKNPIDYQDGQGVLLKALNDIDEWLKVSKKGSYTPVDAEHHTSPPALTSAAQQLIAANIPPSILPALAIVIQSAAASASITGNINSIVTSVLTAATPAAFLENIPSSYQSRLGSLESQLSRVRAEASQATVKPTLSAMNNGTRNATVVSTITSMGSTFTSSYAATIVNGSTSVVAGGSAPGGAVTSSAGAEGSSARSPAPPTSTRAEGLAVATRVSLGAAVIGVLGLGGAVVVL
ncbi:MAG: hypothetical protein Q9213_008048 [Squamulea squamosa]